MQSLLILGRQPALGLAELESLYGAANIRLAGDKTAIVDVDPARLAFERLGGSVKFCRLIEELETTEWREIETFLIRTSGEHSAKMPEGKMQLGLSAIDMKVDARRLGATALTLKKAIKKTGRNVRVIPNKAPELNTAQVLHNGLTKETGLELVLIRDGHKTLVGQTVKVQDIEAYTRRDRERPKRDTRVGMLPPKLAQIIINLAAGELPPEPASPQSSNLKILDPFCGTGVILQEAYLMGYGVYGTDLEARMIDYTRHNMNWLVERFDPAGTASRFETADATSYQWPHEFDLVASETYLGRPLTALPAAEMLAQNTADCNLIIKKFLRNVHDQVKPGTRLCLAIPAWQVKRDQFKHLPLVDQIEDLGYNRVSFEHLGHDGNKDLTYYRPDQIVARQLLVITRK
jgi:tRNA G10  N-methylase Trm11